jgi:hypothetical protein
MNIVKAEDKSDIMEQVIALGDLGKLSPEERTEKPEEENKPQEPEDWVLSGSTKKSKK